MDHLEDIRGQMRRHPGGPPPPAWLPDLVAACEKAVWLYEAVIDDNPPRHRGPGQRLPGELAALRAALAPAYRALGREPPDLPR